MKRIHGKSGEQREHEEPIPIGKGENAQDHTAEVIG